MSISVSTFGTFKGQEVKQFHLVSDTGVEVDIISYGVVVRDWRVPVGGKLRSVVLGFEEFEHYPAHSPHFGSLAGRVANRIANATFDIDGVTYTLPANEGGHSLHGGPEGLGYQVWDGAVDEANNAVTFTFRSPDGAAGYPGTVDFTAVYTLTGNKLRLDLSAKTDKKTPISLVQHQYFNLGTDQTILDHTYQFKAGAYTETGPDLIPTGVIRPVGGTNRDFRNPRNLRDANGIGIAYDGNLVLDAGRDLSEPVATVASPNGDLTLKLWTDRPGLQFYNAVYTDMPVPGIGGQVYKNFSAFCLEDQSFPDAVHHAHFPSVIHSPENPYSHWCEIEIV